MSREILIHCPECNHVFYEDIIDMPQGKPTKDFMERLVELVKEDKELHDAAVRMMNSIAEGQEITNKIRKRKLALGHRPNKPDTKP